MSESSKEARTRQCIKEVWAWGWECSSAGRVAQLVECLPTVHEAPGSIPSTAETGCDIHCNPST